MSICSRWGGTKYLARTVYPSAISLSIRTPKYLLQNTRFFPLSTCSNQWASKLVPSGVIWRRDHRSEKFACPVPHEERNDIERWLLYLEAYIPQEFRTTNSGKNHNNEEKESVGDNSNYDDNNHDVVNCTTGHMLPVVRASESEVCQTVLQLLHQARTIYNFDLLSHLGFCKGRWPAVYSLFMRLVDNAEKLRTSTSLGTLPSNFNWEKLGSFDNITSEELELPAPDAISVFTNRCLPSFDAYSVEPILSGRISEESRRVGTMEELWKTLGNIVLEAADLPLGESRQAMSYFYRIVARLHHENFIPPTVYQYTPPDEASADQNDGPNRPPALHLLSSQIMNVLTEAAWKDHEAEAAEKAVAVGETPFISNFKPWIRELGLEIWLEFVLWCCVEGSYNGEAAWILERLRQRSGDQRWRLKRWSTLFDSVDDIDPRKINEYNTWHQCRKELSARKAPSGPFVGIAPRGITEEVVVSIMDGLINNMKVGVGSRGYTPPQVVERIGMLRTLLGREPLSTGHLNYFLVRMIESGGLVPEVDPQFLEVVLRLSSSLSPERCHSLSKKSILNASTIVTGFHRYLLDSYSAAANVFGAITVFARYIATMDPDKLHSLRQHTFEGEISEPELPRPRSKVINGVQLDAIEPTTPLGLSKRSLTMLIEALGGSGADKFSRWLLGSNGSPGQFLSPRQFADDQVGPAVIRYATLAKDQDLLLGATRILGGKIHRRTARAVISYLISKFDWEAATETFLYLRDMIGRPWGSSNLGNLAGAIVRLDRPFAEHTGVFATPEDHERSLAQAKELLVDLFEGKYNSVNSPVHHIRVYEREMVFQMHQIMLSVPGALSEASKSARLRFEPFHPLRRPIHPYSFNPLLAAIVETRGSAAGKALFETWCVDPWTPEAQRIQPGGTTRLYLSRNLNPAIGGIPPFYDAEWERSRVGKLVWPSLRTVRIIAHGALKELESAASSPYTSAPEQERSDLAQIRSESVTDVIDWARGMFLKFRLNPNYIKRELKGYVPPRRSSVGVNVKDRPDTFPTKSRLPSPS